MDVINDAIIEDAIIQTDEKPKEIINETLSKQEVETKPQDEDMPNEVEALERKAPDDNDENAKEKVIRDKASAILESWSQLQVNIGKRFYFNFQITFEFDTPLQFHEIFLSSFLHSFCGILNKQRNFNATSIWFSHHCVHVN